MKKFSAFGCLSILMFYIMVLILNTDAISALVQP